MAIFHLNAKIIKRSSGHSSVAAAAYCSASRLKDERLDEISDYRLKRGVIYSKIMAPINAPAWSSDRERLWNAVERVEKRNDAQVAREITVALPKELTLGQQKLLLSQFVQQCFVDKGMVADFSIHLDNPNNPHAHILLTMRKIINNSFGGKVREWNNSNLLITWRETWANLTNQYLRQAGYNQEITEKSNAARGLPQQPTIHLGRKNYYALKFRGERLDRVVANDIILHDNAHNFAAEIMNENVILENMAAENNFISYANNPQGFFAKNNGDILSPTLYVLDDQENNHGIIELKK